MIRKSVKRFSESAMMIHPNFIALQSVFRRSGDRFASNLEPCSDSIRTGLSATRTHRAPARPMYREGGIVPLSGALDMDWTWYLFRFDGRINRALFWQALLIVMLLAGLLGLIGQAIHVLNGQRSFTSSPSLSFDFALDELFEVSIPAPIRCCRPPTAPP